MLTAIPALELAAEIIRKRNEDLAKKISQYPRKNSILSDISDCERQMVYSVLDWDKRPLHDEDLQARFDVGNLWEREVIRSLQGLGYDFIMSQAPVTIPNRKGEVIATGKIDGFLKYGSQRIPVEIKSMHPNIFSQIDTIEDFQKKPWLRKYTRQLTMYCYGHNEEWGLFIIVDGMGHWKVLPLALDFGEAEFILQRLERVHAGIQAKTYPDRIPYSREMCSRCPFATTCLPDILNSGLDFVDMPDLVAKRKRMDEIETFADEWLALDKDTKDVAKKVGKDFIAGTDYKIEIKRITGTRVDTKNMPIEERSKWEVPTETVRVNFVPLNGK